MTMTRCCSLTFCVLVTVCCFAQGAFAQCGACSAGDPSFIQAGYDVDLAGLAAERSKLHASRVAQSEVVADVSGMTSSTVRGLAGGGPVGRSAEPGSQFVLAGVSLLLSAALLVLVSKRARTERRWNEQGAETRA